MITLFRCDFFFKFFFLLYPREVKMLKCPILGAFQLKNEKICVKYCSCSVTVQLCLPTERRGHNNCFMWTPLVLVLVLVWLYSILQKINHFSDNFDEACLDLTLGPEGPWLKSGLPTLTQFSIWKILKMTTLHTCPYLFVNSIIYIGNTVNPVLSGHLKRRPKLVFKIDYRLMHVKNIAECSKRAFCNTSNLH